jgi:hypothetical protein
MTKYTVGLSILGLICFALVGLLFSKSADGDKSPSGWRPRESSSSIAPLPAWGAIGRSSDSAVATSAPNPSRPQRAEAQRLFKLYKEKFVNSGIDGRKLLDSIYVLGLAKNADNLRLTRDFLKSTNTSDEKVALSRILASFYLQDDALGANADILGDLRDLVKSGEAEVGNTAALAYSRLGYFPDSQGILSYARRAGYIDDGEYFGELVYLVRLAPKEAQIKILSTVGSSGNAFAIEVLASTLQKPEDLNRYSPDALSAAQSVLAKHQPSFPEAESQFDLTDATRYAMWLQASALISGSGDESKYEKFLLAQLNSAKTDPRGVVSFLISSDGDRLIGRVGQLGLLDYAQSRIGSYAAQNATNGTIQDAVSEVQSKLKATKH